MYVFSEKKATDRIYPIAADLVVFKNHTIQAAKQWKEQRQWFNPEWKAE